MPKPLPKKCRPFTAGTRWYSPEDETAIQAEVHELVERGIIVPSTSASAAACVTVRKKDDCLRLCQDYRGLNELLESYSGGLGDMEAMYSLSLIHI